MGILIGIGGISRAGKSKLSQYLGEQLVDAEVINQDDFVKNESEIPTIKDRIDWEHPDSIDWSSLKDEINKSLKNHAYTLLEGLFAFHNKVIEGRMNLKIQLSLDKSRFLKLKEIDQRWGDEPNWFIEHIWESNQKFGQVHNEVNILKIHNIDNSDYPIIKEQVQNL